MEILGFFIIKMLNLNSGEDGLKINLKHTKYFIYLKERKKIFTICANWHFPIVKNQRNNFNKDE